MISNFRNLAKEHGGQIVKLDLDISTTIDEMLKCKFDKEKENIESELEKTDEENSDEDSEEETL